MDFPLQCSIPNLHFALGRASQVAFCSLPPTFWGVSILYLYLISLSYISISVSLYLSVSISLFSLLSSLFSLLSSLYSLLFSLFSLFSFLFSLLSSDSLLSSLFSLLSSHFSLLSSLFSLLSSLFSLLSSHFSLLSSHFSLLSPLSGLRYFVPGAIDWFYPYSSKKWNIIFGTKKARLECLDIVQMMSTRDHPPSGHPLGVNLWSNVTWSNPCLWLQKCFNKNRKPFFPGNSHHPMLG